MLFILPFVDIICFVFELRQMVMLWFFQLLKIKPAEQGQEYVDMTFVEHKACECR